jgi:phosphomannomutase
MDLANDVRKTMVEKMREKFADLDLTFSIGGQISFDLFPKGWDKTYCLRYVSRHSLPPSLPPSLSFSLLSFLPSRICG